MYPIRLIFISSNALTRSGIAQLVAQAEQTIEVVGVFPDFPAAYKFLDDYSVDVFLIDEALPRHTNLVREVKALCLKHPTVSPIVILHRPTVSIIQQLLLRGVRGILEKDDNLERYLVQAIFLGKLRGLYLSPAISNLTETQRKVPTELAQRHIDVLKLLADGLQPKEIALHVGIGSKSVYRILQSLRDTFDAQSNAHLIAVAHESNLLEAKSVD
jgi:DNA-binding NarL/FixJ family response regulator